MDIEKLADRLHQAEADRTTVPLFTKEIPEMTLEDAYAVQLKNIERKLLQGERVIGYKIGLTSRAMQELIGIDTPDFGHLTDQMLVLEGQSVVREELIQPKVEGELAFCLAHDLTGPGLTPADVYQATAFVVPAIELVDSRMETWRFGLVDTVADNGSSKRFMLGSRMIPIQEVDMRLTGMTLEKNGELLASGTLAQVLGNPAAAVAWLANKLSEYGIVLKAGSIILSGSVTAAFPAEAGDVFTVSFQGMNSLNMTFI